MQKDLVTELVKGEDCVASNLCRSIQLFPMQFMKRHVTDTETPSNTTTCSCFIKAVLFYVLLAADHLKRVQLVGHTITHKARTETTKSQDHEVIQSFILEGTLKII